MRPTAHHAVVIVGGGTAGITVAARLRRAGVQDVAVLDPATQHHYQPLWTLVGGGCAPASASRRAQAQVMPRDVAWLRQAAADIDPERCTVILDDGSQVSYDQLVVAPGIQLDWDGVPGLAQTLGQRGVSSNYRYDLAPVTWQLVRSLRSGTAVFTMPSGPIKCAGAPQKIAYLACDYWREQGVLDAIDVHLVLPTPSLFGVPEFATILEQVVQRYGITVHLSSEVIEVDGDSRQVLLRHNEAGTTTPLKYDLLHAVPPQSAPDWLKATSLADPTNPAGYVEIDQATMQHPRYPNVFALGDAGSSPNSKTGAAIRKQAPVVVSNLLAAAAGREPRARYDGYASCPLTTSRHTTLLAEFDYSLRPHPSFPWIDTIKERRDMGYLKRYGLPAFYWNLMLKGRG